VETRSKRKNIRTRKHTWLPATLEEPAFLSYRNWITGEESTHGHTYRAGTEVYVSGNAPHQSEGGRAASSLYPELLMDGKDGLILYGGEFAVTLDKDGTQVETQGYYGYCKLIETLL
jgi:hypothetical protein